jgi:hypothetical protein
MKTIGTSNRTIRVRLLLTTLTALLALSACGADSPVSGPVIGPQLDTAAQDVGQLDADRGGDGINSPTGCAGNDSQCPPADKPCRVAVCQADGTCAEAAAADASACDDGNACTQADACNGGNCAGSAVICDDGNPCTSDACAPTKGCASVPNQVGCDDGDVCTEGDVCAAGACKPGPAKACDDANGCTNDSCDKTKGCVNAATTVACDDGNTCTKGDGCQGGVCAAGAALDCDDDDACTDDSCNKTKGCAHAHNTAPCDDGDVCSGGDTCAAGTCEAGDAVNCGDGNPCTDDSCDKAKGCSHSDNSGTCSDGNVCTADDACNNGSCVPGLAKPCGDNNSCTDDGCHVVKGCTHSNNNNACDDGDACTVGDACNTAKCVGGKSLGCDDGNPCTDTSCDKVKGCTSKPNTAKCDDGSSCTEGDVCKAGVCAAGSAKVCDDANLCTNDGCHPAKGCTHAHNALPCGDNNACTGGDACKGAKCVAGAKVDCNDGNPCTTDTCADAKGCAYKNNSAACTDGNTCTEGDGCSAGSCKPGTAKVCDDGNGCSSDSCHPLKGCVHAANKLPCNDGDKCTVGDGCAAKACKSGPALKCDDGNPCTADKCEAAKGCVALANTVTCTDANVCTLGDVCADSACVPGKAKVCDDGNPCSSDFCDALKGCQHPNNTAPCNDGSVCTVNDLCGDGICKAGKAQACNDGNICTDDACDKIKGCVALANTVTCTDGSACTHLDKCANGTCGGKPVSCDDGDACTIDLCDVKTGCQHKTPVGFADCGGQCVNTTVDLKHCGKCGQACAPGSICLVGKCLAIVCIPSSKGGCYSGPKGTVDVGACVAGEKTCNGTGTAWLAGCPGEVTPTKAEDCDTPKDDDCNGITNEPSLCGPGEYILSPAPSCGSYCYYDEPHNIAVSKSSSDNKGIGTWAIGQLMDGAKGADAWAANKGKGPAYEWVGWKSGTPLLTFRFPKAQEVSTITVGLNNQVYGGVYQPAQITVSTSLDNKTWTKPVVFALADGSLAKIPNGKRGDVKLKVTKHNARYVSLRFTRVSWTFIDEVVFD